MRTKIYSSLCAVVVCGTMISASFAEDSTSQSEVSLPEVSSADLIYMDDFDKDLSQWVVEQMDGGTTTLENEQLDINVDKGCTVWFGQKLTGPVMFEYEATMIDQGGKNDRVSDLNCFWMATDPLNPEDLFANKERGGAFKNYHSLRLYYVGYGANHNRTTRLRKYPGTGERTLIDELREEKFMNTPNKTSKIQIVANGNTIQYWHDGQMVFDFLDEDPLTEGWFGFRTVHNHMRLDNFRVYRLLEGNETGSGSSDSIDYESDFQKLFDKVYLSYNQGNNNHSDATGENAGRLFEERATGFGELLEMAIAISNPSSPYFEDEDMTNHILKALDDYYTANPKRAGGWNNNFGRQHIVGPLCVLMKKYMSPELRLKIYEADFKREPYSVGTNLIHNGEILIWAGLFTDRVDDFEMGLKALKSCIPINNIVGHETPFELGTPGYSTCAGIKPDASWWHHGHQMYTAHYGMASARELSFWGHQFEGLEYAFSEEEIRCLAYYILDHIQWVNYRGYMDYHGEGRFPGSRFYKSKLIDICRNMMVIDEKRAEEYKGFTQYLENPAYTNITGNRHFWVSDYSVHRRENFHIGIKVASDRTHVQEGPSSKQLNDDGYYLSQGGMVIAVHGDELADIFDHKDWNWSGIPGTTSRQMDDVPAPEHLIGTSAFAGGVSDGQNGVMAFDMDWDGTQGKKSWFMFDDLIVALGCDIRADAGEPINTTINQAWRRGNVSIGYETKQQNFENGSRNISNPQWVFHNNVGYIFPSRSEVVLKASDDLFSLHFDHGVKPQGAEYQYTIAPSVEVEEMDELVQDNPIVVLQNGPECQAVFDTKSNTTGIVFYLPGTLALPAGIQVSVDMKCALMLKVSGEELESITAASPASETGTLNLILHHPDGAKKTYEIELPKDEMAGQSVIEEIDVYKP